MLFTKVKGRTYNKIQLRPIDDAMFKKLAESKAVCQEILRVILNDKKLIVEGLMHYVH